MSEIVNFQIIDGNVFDSLMVKNSMVVHGCNCQGVMGSGVAAQVRILFPKVYNEYVRKHQESGLKLGEIQCIPVLPNNRFIVNAMTQDKYGREGIRYVSYDAIRECFKQIREFALANDISSINYPAIGAGLGGGDLEIIMEIINEELEGLNHTLWIPKF